MQDQDQDWAALANEWIRHLDEDLNRPWNTVYKTYQPRLLKWLDWCERFDIDVGDPSPSDVLAYARRHRIKCAGSPSASTIKNDVLALKSWYRWLYNFGHSRSNPLLKVPTPQVAKCQPKPVSDEVWWACWDRDLLDRTRLWLGWLYWCGLRRQEAADLRTGDLYRGSSVEVVRKGGEVVQLPWLKLGELITTLQVERGWPQAEAAFDDWVKLVEAARRSGREFLLPYKPLPSGKLNGNYLNKELIWAGEYSITPHRCRHSFITNMAKLGATIDEIAELVGHRSIETTRGYLDSRSNLVERLLATKSSVVHDG